MVLTDKALKKIIKANNKFCAIAYKEISKDQKGNFVFSSLSAEIALAFAQSGCSSETKGEILTSLQLPTNQDEIKSGVKALFDKLNNEFYSFMCLTTMFLKEEYIARDKFKDVGSEVYHAEIENINFANTEKAIKTINFWIEEHTYKAYCDIIESSDLNNDTKILLINVLHFKANWKSPFLISNTRSGIFYKTSDDFIMVEIMCLQEKYFNYCESFWLNAQILELPFIGDNASMIIVLPKKTDGLSVLENRIGGVFDSFKFKTQLVNVTLPMFKIESKINLKKVLKNLGVKKVFTEDEADISGIINENNDTVINKIIQAMSVTVNEDGVEESSGPAVVVAGQPRFKQKRPKTFLADHPFIFYIKAKNAIVLAGRVLVPLQ